MKTEIEKDDDRIDRFLIGGEQTPAGDFTEQTLNRIRTSRQTLPLSFPIPLALALAACLVAALFLPSFLNHVDKTEPLLPVVASPEEQLYLDDILLLAEPFDRKTPLIDEQTMDLLAMLTENSLD